MRGNSEKSQFSGLPEIPRLFAYADDLPIALQTMALAKQNAARFEYSDNDCPPQKSDRDGAWAVGDRQASNPAANFPLLVPKLYQDPIRLEFPS